MLMANYGHIRRLYATWLRIQNGCNDRYHSTFKQYGGRGIVVCEDWDDYLVFRDWAMSQGYDPTAPRGVCTVQRHDPDGDFDPENCYIRWKNPHQ